MYFKQCTQAHLVLVWITSTFEVCYTCTVYYWCYTPPFPLESINPCLYLLTSLIHQGSLKGTPLMTCGFLLHLLSVYNIICLMRCQIIKLITLVYKSGDFFRKILALRSYNNIRKNLDTYIQVS